MKFNPLRVLAGFFSLLARFLSSTRLALVLIILILLSSAVGVILPQAVGKEVVFASLWFNSLLVLLIVNIVFCIFWRIKILRLSKVGTTVFHLSLVLLFAGVVYDQLFFFEGVVRLTEGETLSLAGRASYDRVSMGRFFNHTVLEGLGEIYLHKVHAPYWEGGKYREVANEFAVGEDVQTADPEIIFVTRPLKYKGFEFYRDKEGYSPLFVLRDLSGVVLYGAYAPLQSIKQEDGTYLYRSGSATEPGGFNFPQDPGPPSVYKLQTTYYPDKEKKRAGEVLFQVWPSDPDSVWKDAEGQEEKEIFKGRVALRQTAEVGGYLLSMDEVRYWSSMKVIYRPGVPIIFVSFWLGLAGITLSVMMKMRNGGKKTA